MLVSLMYLRPPRWWISALVLLLIVPMFLSAPAAFADSGGAVPHTEPLLFGMVPIWTAFAGLITILGGYLVNHFAFWNSEPVKALFVLVYSTIAGAITQLIDAGTISWDSHTLQYVVGTLLFALALHFGLLKPGGVNVLFKAGSNASGAPSTKPVAAP